MSKTFAWPSDVSSSGQEVSNINISHMSPSTLPFQCQCITINPTTRARNLLKRNGIPWWRCLGHAGRPRVPAVSQCIVGEHSVPILPHHVQVEVASASDAKAHRGRPASHPRMEPKDLPAGSRASHANHHTGISFDVCYPQRLSIGPGNYDVGVQAGSRANRQDHCR